MLVPRSATVAGSGTAARPGAVICPLPEKETAVGSVTTTEGIDVPVAVAEPVAPLKIPVPLRIVTVFENVGKPMALGAPNSTESVPSNVFAPPLNEATKVFITEDGTKIPEGNITYVIVPASAYIALPKGTKGPEPLTVVGRLGVDKLGVPNANASPEIENVNCTVAACAVQQEPKASAITASRKCKCGLFVQD